MGYGIYGLILLVLVGYVIVRWMSRRTPQRPKVWDEDGQLRSADNPAAPAVPVDPELVRQVEMFQTGGATPGINRIGTTQQVRVALGQRGYDVRIKPGLLDEMGHATRAVAPGRAAFIITDSNVRPLYADRASASLAAAGFEVRVASFPAGEMHKTLLTVSTLFDQLFAAPTPPDRDSVVVALGGGVVGDVAGFVAATLLRGVTLVQAPTTLLADVDSSVGGKTGVDHSAGKNLIGAFHQPRAVLIDPQVLATLPPVEFSSGLAECVKHGIIRDGELIPWIEANAEHLRPRSGGAALPPEGAQRLAELIARNVAIKAAIVAADEHEQDKGPRSHLNFGHTVGHAIETAYGFGGGGEGDYLRHGHCVALGMVGANRIAVARGLLSGDDAARVEALLIRLGLPVRLAGLSADSLLGIMRHDKKARAGRLRFVLPAVRLGCVAVHEDVLEVEIRSAIEYLARGPGSTGTV